MKQNAVKNTKRIGERALEKMFFLCACISVTSVALMCLFIFNRGLPLFGQISVIDFLTGKNWAPTQTPPSYGILPFIVGSVYVTFLALLLAIPVGVSTGIFLSEMSGRKTGSFLRSAVEVLAGIPSIIYGLFGITFIVPLIRNIFGGNGYSVLASALILAIMTLPTIINMTDISIRSVPSELREGSYALGATKWQTITGVLLPAARSGIVTGVVLGMGRAMGETMAVLLVGGNAPILPKLPVDMVRTLTMNIITDMSYAEGMHRTSLFSTGIVLFAFILFLNVAIQMVLKNAVKEQSGRI